MTAKVKPQSKESYSHWTVIATFCVIVAIIVSFPCIPDKPSPKPIPEPTASFGIIQLNREELIPPPIMRQTVDIPKTKLENLIPENPKLPNDLPYQSADEFFLKTLRAITSNAATNSPSNNNPKENSN